MSRLAPNNLQQRIISSVILLPFLGVTVWMGGAWVPIVDMICTVLALHELYQLFALGGNHPRAIGYFCAVLFVVAATLQMTIKADLAGLTLILTIIATLISEFPRPQHEGALLAWALTFSGATYVGWTMAHFVLLRQLATPLNPAPLAGLGLEPGAAWLVLALFVTFASDTLAFVTGRRWGRHPMAPYISPKKSWEGAIGGLLGGILAGGALVPVLGLPISITSGALVGAVGSVAGQAGDLAESLLKRQVGAKDSGTIIPGHGGILDRADSLLFAVPTVYYLVRWLTG